MGLVGSCATGTAHAWRRAVASDRNSMTLGTLAYGLARSGVAKDATDAAQEFDALAVHRFVPLRQGGRAPGPEAPGGSP